MAAPTWANLGPANGGTGPVTINWPNNYATNDMGYLICQSSNEPVTETSGGWTLIAETGVGTPGAAGSTRITVFQKRVTNGGGETPAALADSGDHQNGIIAVVRGCPTTGDPIEAFIMGTDAVADTSLDIPGLTTLGNERLILIAACHAVDTLNPEWSGEIAPNLNGLVERYDKSITIGNGGGTAIWSGSLEAAGSSGPFSATGLAASVKAWVVLALKPKPRLLNLNPIAAAPGPWINSNYGAGGTWAHIAAGPTGIILCAGDEAGVWISFDRGSSWSPRGNHDGFQDQFVAAVAFDPIDETIMYAGSAHGLYRSGDTGTSWTKVSGDLWIADVLPAESNPNIVYALYHPVFDSLVTGVLRSVDRGLTFVDVANNLPANLHVNRLMVDTQNPAILYLLSSYHDFNHTPDFSIWRSADSGATWSRISGPLEAVGKPWDCVIDRLVPTTLWATIYTGDPFVTPFAWAGSTWVSTDSGGTWTQKNAHTGNVLVKYGRSDTIWVVDNKRNTGASEEGFWESTDSGGTWVAKSHLGDYDFGWQANVDRAYGAGNYGISHGFGQDLSDPNAIFQISPQFVHASFDGGLVFHNLYTFQVSDNYWTSRRLENLTVADIRISEANAGLIFSGAFDTGMWRSRDGGYSWQSCNSPDFTGDWNGEGGNTCTIMPDPANENVVWAAQGRTETTSNLVKNINKGDAGAWFAVTGLPADKFVYGLSIDKRSPAGNRILFVTIGSQASSSDPNKTGDVYRSTDDGLNWTLVLQPAAAAGVHVTAVDCADSNLVYAAGEGGFWRSTTGGAFGSWTLLATPADFTGSAASNSLGALRWTGVAWIEADPTVPNRVWAACYGDTGTNRGLYRSDDRGGTWTKVFTGDYVRRVAISRTNPGHVYLSSGRVVTSPATNSHLSLGVRRSTDTGATWAAINDNLPWTVAGALAVGTGSTYVVFAASMGNGFWHRWFGTQEITRSAAVAVAEESRGAPDAGTEETGLNWFAFAGIGPVPVDPIAPGSDYFAEESRGTPSATEDSAPSQA